jgi:hypothetical protein
MKKITFILFALFTCWQINAQVSSYAFAESTEAYAQITGTTSTATGDDGTQTNIPIGFTFNYGGTNYSAFGISTNGIIRLGSNATDTAINSGWTNGLSNTAANRPLIAPLWDDNHLGSGTIRYAVTGSTPNQVLTINWHNTKIGGGGTNGGADVSTIIRLYETTNVIEIVYSTPFTTSNTVSASVGLNDATSFLSVTPAATSTVSSATANNGINATVMANLAGKKLTFTPPSCAAPAGFVASAVTPTTATISWNAAVPAPSVGYQYYYSTVNTAPSGAGTATSNLTENLTGLSVNTPYYVWLRSDCGGGTFSAWAGPFTFTTPCNPYSVPYFEGFESGYTHNTTVAGCLTQSSVTGAGVWTANSTFTDYNRTPRTGSFNAFLVYSNEDWMYIPIQLVGGTSYRVSFYARQDGAVSANSNMAVSYGSANNAAAMTNSIVAATGIINGNYQEIFGDFTPVTSGTYYVGIKGFMNGTPWYISLDDISINVSPTCLNPTAILASNITSNSVDLSWTDGSGGLQFDYEYAIQAPGTGIPTGAGAPINDVTVLAEGFDINGNPLTANTLYEVYVRADCSGGSFSTWSGPITFRTLCNSVGTINENFDSVTTPALPDCWSKILRGATLSSFATVTTTANTTNSAPNSAALYNSSSATTTTDDIILVSPVLSNLNAGTHRLKFYAKTTGSIQVGTLNNNTASAVFTPFQTIATTATSTLYVVDFSTYAGTDTFIGFRHNSGTFVTLYVDDVVWEPIPATAPSCASNIVATPNASCGNFANSITWDATPNADGYYITVGTTTGGTDVANASSITTNTYSFSGNIGTTYFYTIVPFNAIGSATGCTEQSFTTNASGCYCVSAPTSVDGTGITNVQLVATNFANTVSTSPVYNDHTATVVDMSQGISNSVQITFNTDSFGTSYDYNTVIWIDVNDNFTFEPSEIVFTGVSAAVSPTILNASFVMPGTAPLGQHRMRIVATDALQTPANPCYSGSYGETADFTVNVVAATCTPPAATTSIVPACGTTQFSIDVNVTALGSGTPSISDGTTTWPISAIGVVNVGPFASGSSVTLTLLHGSDVTCNLPLGSLTYSCPPANDDCANAIALTPGGVFGDNDIVGTNAAATASAGETAPGCASYLGGDVWYSAVVPASGSLTFELNTSVGGITDGAGAVYSGTCGSLVLLGCNDSASSDPNDQPLVTVTGRTPGEVLYFRVWEYGNNAFGTFLVSTYDASLSSGSFDNANFSAYPNPVKDVLNVSYTSEISSVKIINMLGQEVISKNINATSSQIDMSQLSAGTYIVNVTVGDTIKTLKVVKQ